MFKIFQIDQKLDIFGKEEGKLAPIIKLVLQRTDSGGINRNV